MHDHTSYETASEAINALIQRGYTLDFNLHEEEDCLICKKTTAQLSPREFEIDEFHRFEGMTDPGDEMIVFAISSKLDNAKGILVNAYGMYSDSNASMIVEKLKQHLH